MYSEKSGYKNNLIQELINIFEICYFIIFGIFLYKSYIGTTMRIIEWPANFYENIQMFLWWIVGIKLALNLLNGNVSFKKALLIMMIYFSAYICYKTTVGYEVVLDTAVLAIGALDIDYKKILKIYFIVSVIITVTTIIQSKTGAVIDLIYYREGHIRDAFGFVYPTDFAAHIFFIVCTWIVLRNKKTTYAEIGIIGLIAVFLQIKCQARCSVLSLILLCFFMIALHNQKKIIMFVNKYRIKLIYLVCLIPVAFAGTMICLGKSKVNNGFIALLDKALSTRISLGREAFEKYDIKLWGQFVYMNGNGGSTVPPQNYFFIDCSYINILLRFGLAVFITVMISIFAMLIKNRRNCYVVGVLLLICLHSVIEHHMFEYFFNIFIILPLADFEDTEKNIKKLKYKMSGKYYG